MFQTFQEALDARRELCAAGYDFKVLPEIDPYSQATFVEVWRSSHARLDEEVLWGQLQAIVEPLRGEVHEAALIENPTLERQQHRLQ